MDGEQNGTQAQQVEGQQQEQASQQSAQQEQQAQGKHAREDGAGGVVAAGSGNGVDAEAFSAQLAERDSRIEELEARIAEAAKSAEAADGLRAEVAALKQRGADERIEFSLLLAGCRNVKAARAMLDDHGGDVDALKAAEPWAFQDAPAKAAGKTGLPNAGAASDKDVEEAGLVDCFVAAGSELQRTQAAPEGDAYTLAKIAGFGGVTAKSEGLSGASAESLLASLCEVTSAMDERQVSAGTRYLFITPTLKGVIDDFSYSNPNRSNRVLERFARIVEVPQIRFYTAIDLLIGGENRTPANCV